MSLTVAGCATTFIEVQGECVLQQWQFLGWTMRQRTLCDLPPPAMTNDGPLRERGAMRTNPFPGLIDRNEADSLDPNLLEKTMKYPQPEDEEQK